MGSVLHHRGPDDEGYYAKGPAALGHRRLSIIDLDAGRQPIANEDETVWIVFNGEIYNFQVLRSDLISRGHRFRTHTDTEVIVHLYEEYGEKCVDRLSGMFAFAIWDETKKRLFIARDRCGQKPLFYYHKGGDFLFASELKGLIASGDVQRDIDFESVHHYLSLRFIPSPHTMLKGVRKLQPGHWLSFEHGKVTIQKYWGITFRNQLQLGEDEYIDRLRDSMTRAVTSHLMSDVPVGAFLSGGMDSSMIVALMAGTQSDPFKTFCVGVEQNDFNEQPYAREVAEYHKTDHVEEMVRPDLIALLPKMIYHLDEPSDPIAACMFHSSRLASRHVKVVLGGDGGDELFAGFDRYRGVGLIDYYAIIPTLIRRAVLGPIIDIIPDSFTYKSVAQKMRWVHQLSALPTKAERYAEATAFFRFNHAGKQQIFGDDIWRNICALQSSDIITKPYNEAEADNPIDRMLYADFQTRLPEHTLMLTDRMSMAHSLEARSPFLDHELVELLAAFPSRVKIRGKQLKYILRKLAEGYLPPSITRRDKQGFMFPVAYWFRNELYEFLKKFLSESKIVTDGMFKREAVLGLIEEHRRNKIDNHVRIWMLLNLEIWRRMYVDGNDLDTMAEDIDRCRRDSMGSAGGSGSSGSSVHSVKPEPVLDAC